MNDSFLDTDTIWGFDKYCVELLNNKNAPKYQDVLDSIKYITKYSGYNPEKISAIDSVMNPELPLNGKLENNKIFGILQKDNNTPIAWIQFYEKFVRTEVVFLGELFVGKEFQGNGVGRKTIQYFENIWKENGCKLAILNVDLKNWDGIRFWVKMGYSKIEKVIGDDEYSENTFAMIRLSKEL